MDRLETLSDWISNGLENRSVECCSKNRWLESVMAQTRQSHDVRWRIRCDLKAVPSSRHSLVLKELQKADSCDPSFLDVFAQVGHRIATRWAAPLSGIGDVQECVASWLRLRHHMRDIQLSRFVPAWMGPSLFAVHHQLRYSDLQNELRSLREAAALIDSSAIG